MKTIAFPVLWLLCFGCCLRAETQAKTPPGLGKTQTQLSSQSDAEKTSWVEPLSIPLQLSMGSEDVLQKFGKPKSDTRFFGGGLTYPEFRVMFNTQGTEIRSVTLQAPVRLACGIGPGDTLEKVRERFTGGRIVYGAYEVESGPYALSFLVAEGRVSTLTIRPSGERFEDSKSRKKPDASRPAATAKSLAGQWLDPENGQSLELLTNGTYRTGAGGTGHFTVEGDRLVFTGALSAWDQGRATLSQPDVLEFYWTNAEGFKNYFAFLRVVDKPGK
jgi:hypothetical protein